MVAVTISQQLIHRHLIKGFTVCFRLLCQNVFDQRHSAGRNSLDRCPLRFFLHRGSVRQYLGCQPGCSQLLADFTCERGGHFHCFLLVGALHGYQDGTMLLIKVALGHHRTDNGVDSYIQGNPSQVHLPQDFLGLAVKSLCLQNTV